MDRTYGTSKKQYQNYYNPDFLELVQLFLQINGNTSVVFSKMDHDIYKSGAKHETPPNIQRRQVR